MTRAELAALLKAKYPAYASIPDDELVTKIVTKYPAYQAQITEAAPATPPPPTPANRSGGTGVTPTSDTGFVGGFLETSPINPANLVGMVKGAWQPTADAGLGVVRDLSQGNLVKAGLGAMDVLQGGPAKRAMVFDPAMKNLVGGGEALAQGDMLKAAEQFAGAIPGNAGILELGQQNAGNPAALAGNLTGVFTAPRIARGAVEAGGKGVALAESATAAAKSTGAFKSAASTVARVKDIAKASVSREAVDQAGSTAVTTGAITMNPLVGLSAGVVELAKKVIPEFIERWRNNGATVKEIEAATKAAEKAAENKIKYRGVSKDEFREMQDHLAALKEEAAMSAKNTRGREQVSFKSGGIEVKIYEQSLKAQATAEAEVAAAAKRTDAGAASDLKKAQAKLEAAERKTAADLERAEAIQNRRVEAQAAKADQRRERGMLAYDVKAGQEAAKAQKSSPAPTSAAPAPASGMTLDAQGRPLLSDPATFRELMASVKPKTPQSVKVTDTPAAKAARREGYIKAGDAAKALREGDAAINSGKAAKAMTTPVDMKRLAGELAQGAKDGLTRSQAIEAAVEAGLTRKFAIAAVERAERAGAKFKKSGKP